LKFRISKRAHLGQVEAFQFTCRPDALAYHNVYQPISEISDREHYSDQGCASDDLRDRLESVLDNLAAVPMLSMFFKRKAKSHRKNNSDQ